MKNLPKIICALKADRFGNSRPSRARQFDWIYTQKEASEEFFKNFYGITVVLKKFSKYRVNQIFLSFVKTSSFCFKTQMFVGNFFDRETVNHRHEFPLFLFCFIFYFFYKTRA